MTLKKGFDAAQTMMEEQAAERAARAGAFNFFIKKGESARIVFLEDEPGALVYQFTHKIGDRFEDFICQGDASEYRDLEKRPTLVGYFTIIQLGEFKGKNGVVKNPKRTLAAKSQTLDILKRHFAKRGGLYGRVFEVSRSNNDKSPAVGDMWDFEETLDQAALEALNEDITPINFDETLKSKQRSPEQMKKILQGQAEENSAKAKETEEVEW